MLVLLSLLLAAPPIPSVTYKVSATVGTWQPLEVADVAKTIGESSLEVLSRPGLMQIEKTPGKDTDYLVEVKGRLLDEAETHTIYLSFGPNKKSDLPSFRVSDTVVLSKLDRKAMVARIAESSKKAAAELLALMKPQLERKDGVAPPSSLPEAKPPPWKWPDVVIPTGMGKGGDLFSKSSDTRRAALRSHVSQTRAGDAGSRHALERCALDHPEEEMRLGCLAGLKPASRHVGTTQRVVVDVYRKDKADRVRQEADEQMQYYSGPARDEAIQAWLESAAQGRVSGVVDQLGDVPNLDSVIRSCMVSAGKREKYQRNKSQCLELLDPLSVARRRAILWRFLEETDADSPYYLEGAGEREGSIGTDWQRAAEAILDVSTSWDPGMEEILWRRYQRALSSFALDALAGYGAPSDRLTDRLLEALQTGGDHQVLWGLTRFAKKDPKLAPKIKEQLAMMLQTGSYPKTLNKRSLEEAVKKL